MNQNTNPPPSASKPKEIKLNIPPVLKIVLGLLFAIDATVIPLSFTYEWAATIALPALAIVTFLAMVIKNRDLSIGFVMLVPGALLWMMTGTPRTEIRQYYQNMYIRSSETHLTGFMF